MTLQLHFKVYFWTKDYKALPYHHNTMFLPYLFSSDLCVQQGLKHKETVYLE